MQNKTVLVLLISLAFLIFFASFAYVSIDQQNSMEIAPGEITSFEECVAAGFPVMESYPPKCSDNNRTFIKEYGRLTQEQARTIAGEQCIKGGAVASLERFDENSRSWWFRANLNSTQPGCQSFCVVSDDDATTNIEWLCDNEQPKDEAITELFRQKYPQYAETLQINIDSDEEIYVRGSISFNDNPDTPGGIFLARMANGVWEINHDGNGQISCDLRIMGYPEELISDCTEN